MSEDGSGEFHATRDGIERSIQRVLGGVLVFYVTSVAAWAAHHSASAVAVVLLVTGCCALLALAGRAWAGRLSRVDVGVAVAMVPAALGVNALVDASGIGVQGGPAYLFMLAAILLAAIVLPWHGYALAAGTVATAYLAGRGWQGGRDGLLDGLDEIVTELGTISAVALAIGFYRRSGERADAAAGRRFAIQALQARATARDVVLAERRRVIHDDVIAALVTIRSARTAHSGASAAGRALDAIAAFSVEQSQPDTSWVRDGLLTIEVDAQVDRHPGSTERPPHVAAALAGAVREALRNADRHSGASVARLHVEMVGDGVTATVSDDGCGFDTSGPVGFGIRESIRARVEAVGGTVRIDSAPGRGTTVVLAWEPGHPDEPQAHDDLAILRADVGSIERFTLALTALASVSPLWLLARHGTEADRWPLAVGVALLLLAATVGVALLVARRRLRVVEVAAIAVVWAAGLAVGLALAPEGALLDFDSWMVQVVAVVLFTVSFFVPVRALAVIAMAQFAVVASTIAADPLVGPSDALDPLLLAPVYAAGLGAAAAGFRRADREAMRQEAAAARETIEHAHRSARRAAVADLDLVVRRDLEDFLVDVRDGVLDVTLPAVQERAHVLAVQTRDELYLPGVLDAELHTLLATARTAGAEVTIRPSPVMPSTDRTARLLRAALDPDRLAEATLTLPDRVDDRARLVIVPPLSDARVAHVVDELDDLSPVVECVEHATIVTVVVGRATSVSVTEEASRA